MMPSRWIIYCALAAFVAAVVAFTTQPASAIPAWARKYDMDCSGCHAAGFKLTRMGQDFLRSGHQMEGGPEKENLSDHVSVAQKIRYTVSKGELDDGSVVALKSTFEQHALSVYMGGSLQKEFSYFAELYWHENSGNTSGSSDLNDYARSKLADAYLQYVNRQGERQYTSVRFGQFSPYLLHLHGVGARLSQDRPYVINSGTVGANPYKPFARQYGIEIAQSVEGFTATAALVNGTGGKLFNRVDNDLRKDVYGTLDYSIDDDGSMIGVYGYKGHYPVNKDVPATYLSADDFQQLGVMGNFTRAQGAVVGAFFSGNDEFTLVASPGGATEQKSMGYYAELQVYAIHPRLAPYVRYDFWDVDTDVDDNEVMGPLVGLSWRALDAGRLVVHVQQLKTKSASPGLERTDNSLVFEANFMF